MGACPGAYSKGDRCWKIRTDDDHKGTPLSNKAPTLLCRAEPELFSCKEQPPRTANCELPATANRQPSPITKCQPPSATNRHQPPTANR